MQSLQAILTSEFNYENVKRSRRVNKVKKMNSPNFRLRLLLSESNFEWFAVLE